MKRVLIVVVVVTFAAAAVVGAADFVVEPSSPTSAGDVPTCDATIELKWDNGTLRWSVAWYSGAGSCVGNDFDLSTISAYRAVEMVRFYSRDNWPNAQWDGFRVGIYDFSAVPGSLLWPTSGSGYFFKPTGLHGHIWVDVPIGWTCPATSFVVAVEQYYNYPNCEPYAVDSNPTFRGHSWQYFRGVWSPYESLLTLPYRNIMIRAVVDDTTTAVSPASLGRVKALFR